jgi:thiamine-phosphate pyrophosphorylase
VGRSCHTICEAQSVDADLITFGPIFATPNKGPALGLSALTEVCQAAKHKLVFALGGITWENADSCISAGAAGVAGIRLFQQVDFPRKLQ